MNQYLIHGSTRFLQVSHGNGLAYTVVKNPPEDWKNMPTSEILEDCNHSIFVQGDDALQFQREVTRMTEGVPSLDYDDALQALWEDYHVGGDTSLPEAPQAVRDLHVDRAANLAALCEHLSTEPLFPDPVPEAIAAGDEDGRPAAWLLRRDDGTWHCALGNGTPAAFSYAGICGSEEVACKLALKAAKTGTEAKQAVFDHARRYLSGPHEGRTVHAYSFAFPAQPLQFMTERPVSGNLTAHSITIMWGSCPEEGDTPKTYTFDTDAELEAFLQGVEEMDGWGAWREIEEGHVWCFECNEAVPADESGKCVSCAEEDTCRVCGEEYADGGDGFDGMCPTCADAAEEGEEDE